MNSDFLLYGSTGFVGQVIAELAVQKGLNPILAGRNESKIKAQAKELDLPYCVFSLDDASAMDAALKEVKVVLHCAGPFIFTANSMVEGCLRTGTNYLDLSGEIPVYESLFARDIEAKNRGIMILPGTGFDVVPTDCLALHLKQRLPTATQLTLAYQTDGPAGLPPGTAKTMVEMVSYGNKRRLNGEIETPPRGLKTQLVDFGHGEKLVTMLAWGDVFMAYHSTGIPNIEVYAATTDYLKKQMAIVEVIRPIFKWSFIRKFFKTRLKAGSTADERSNTRTHVWGEVKDEIGNRATARLHGPEAGVIWTAQTALASVQKVLADQFVPGFQTPARVFGSEFVLENDQVFREDLF